MSTMPGNPHIAAELLEYAGRDQTETQAVVAATLALAYEQRTANLIALWQMEEESAIGFNAANDFDASAWTTVPRQIAARLGLK